MYRGIVFAMVGVSALPLLGLATSAHADEVSGRWSGAVEMRGNYYYERSTRVIAPTIAGELVAPNGTQVRASYMADAITSASLATGAVTDVAFTELRNEVNLGVGKSLRLGDNELRLDAYARVSKEPDYLSTGGGLLGSLALAQRTTALNLGLTYTHDDVSKVLRGLNPDGSNRRDIGKVGELDGVVLNLSIDQVLTPVLSLQLGYDLGYLQGFLQNAYRQVPVQGVLRAEQHPDARWRHTFYGRLAYYVEPSRSALHLAMRSYVDSWGIVGWNPELRVYQELGNWVQLRLRYRYYVQSAASFYEPAADYASDATYVTADPKMSRFHNHIGGLQVLWSLGFLHASWLRWLKPASIDANFDHIWNTNRFGNGVVAQLGLRLPL